jgi:caffeoyl-CoA O-methyltransferase
MDLNIPMRDGQFLYDLIIEHGYTHALEIGTSTGHSSIWIAWALSRTGGKLITIEINESRYREALSNFREAGVSEYIDARLADAHKLVKELEGPFDFVFSDADKDWYKQYFIDVAPKVSEGGCFTAHNIQWRSRMIGIREFVEYVMGRHDFQTTIETDRSTGISVSFKKPVGE